MYSLLVNDKCWHSKLDSGLPIGMNVHVNISECKSNMLVGIMIKMLKKEIQGQCYGVLCLFQPYSSNIMAISFIGGEDRIIRRKRPQKKYMFLYVIHLCTAFLYIAVILTSYIILSDPSSSCCLRSTVYIFQLSFCLSGNLSSQCFEPNTRHLLCSFKPSQKHPTVRHQLCEMNYVNVSPDPTALDMSCSCDIIQTFHAGRTQTLLSKSVVLPHPSMDNNLIVCAGDESTQSVCSL